MYAITGSTGNTGRVVAEILLEQKQEVRAIGRSPTRLKGLADRGAEPCVGNLDDAGFLTKAFKGARAVFAMIPPNLQAEDLRDYQGRIGEATAAAIGEAGVRFVVFLSSLGAHLPEGTGPILGLHDQEERLNKIEGIRILHLRPTFFMENLLHNIPLIQKMGINGSPLRGDLRIPVIATKDVAGVASDHLLHLDFRGVTVRELLGERDISMEEMTGIIGKAIGKHDLRYIQFSYEDARKGMMESGLSSDVSRSFVELYQSFNEGTIFRGIERTAENTTETTFEEFGKIFAQNYRGK